MFRREKLHNVPSSCFSLQESDPTLEGAKARLAQLKERLYQREREITELLEEERTPVPPIALPYCTILLPTLIHKVQLNC